MWAGVPATAWNETTGRKDESQGRNRIHCWGPELGTKEDKIKGMLSGQGGTKDSGAPSQIHATVALRGCGETKCRGTLLWPRPNHELFSPLLRVSIAKRKKNDSPSHVIPTKSSLWAQPLYSLLLSAYRFHFTGEETEVQRCCMIVKT